MMASHVVAGSVALVAGVAAMASRKGGSLHLLAGQAFTVAMLLMAVPGGAIGLRGAYSPESWSHAEPPAELRRHRIDGLGRQQP